MTTPLPISNRPGLSAIAYRCGTHAEFKQTMLTQLAVSQGLHTHDDSDFTVALLDAVASMAEIVSFYQERIANEAFVRTATERRSLVELGRLIDYAPRPGVAASVYLAFTMQGAPGAPDQAAPPITIGPGLKAQSLPGPGEQPQSFETVETIAARPDWNAIGVRMTQPQALSATMGSVLVQGTATGVQPGSLILIAADSQALPRVVAVTVDTVAGTTRIDLVSDPPDPPPFSFPIYGFGRFFTEPLFLEDDVVASRIFGFNWRQHDLVALGRVQNWSFDLLRLNFRRQAAQRSLPPEQGVFAFGQKAAVFGHNAPVWNTLADTQKAAYAYPDGWDAGGGLTLAQQTSTTEIDLDRVYAGIVIGSAIVLDSETDRQSYRVEEVFELSRADFTLSGKITRLRLDSSTDFSTFTVRGTSVYLQSLPLVLADLPIVDAVSGSSVTLDGPYLELATGQTVILTGTRTDLSGVVASEAMTIADITFIDGYTTLTFQQALANIYARASVAISANVALATHGETVANEVLGSGDASQPFQSFTLRQSPLTYVSSDGPSGAQSTLQIGVNALPWQETPGFFGHAAADRVFVASTGDDGVTTVEFGDGVQGARPATGSENILATYRKGMGSAGNVDAGKIILLPVRPLGVRSVGNPLPASGATDPEQIDDIRRNAALTIRTLDRIVSLLDYQDFARAFAGVAKALASWSWIGRTRAVLVTVAAAGGTALTADGPVLPNLLSAMRAAGDPNVTLRVQSYRPAFFRLAATLTIAPDAATDAVQAAVEATLRAAFSFDLRDFGQDVALSEVLAAIQGVPGIVAAQVTEFYRTDDPDGGGLATVLAAAAPQSGGTGELLAAELLTIDPRPLDLVGVQP